MIIAKVLSYKIIYQQQQEILSIDVNEHFPCFRKKHLYQYIYCPSIINKIKNDFQLYDANVLMTLLQILLLVHDNWFWIIYHSIQLKKFLSAILLYNDSHNLHALHFLCIFNTSQISHYNMYNMLIELSFFETNNMAV